MDRVTLVVPVSATAGRGVTKNAMSTEASNTHGFLTIASNQLMCCAHALAGRQVDQPHGRSVLDVSDYFASTLQVIVPILLVFFTAFVILLTLPVVLNWVLSWVPPL